MKGRFDPKANISDDEALCHIRHILDHGTVHFSNHARERMQHRNFTTLDILYILETGKITDKEYDVERCNWKYKVSGVDLDGDDGNVVTAILSAHEQLIISAF